MARIRRYLLDYSLEKKTNKALNLFWIGFIIYSVSYTLMISGNDSSKISSYLQLIGVVIFVIPAIRLIRFKIENKYLKVIYVIYCGWLFLIITRGFVFEKEFLLITFVDGTGGLFLYLVPLILLFPQNLIYLKKVINVILILSVFYILYDIVFIKSLLASDSESGQTTIEFFSKFLGFPCGFILLTYIYHSDKRRLWALFVIILTFILAMIRARRGLMFMSASILLFAYIIYIYATRDNFIKRFFPLIIIVFLVLIGANVYDENKAGAFSLITERLNEDTRTGVEEYFYLDMNKIDWIIGRGINGLYYCPHGATEDGFRGVIETNYLQIILKGGLISLGLLLLIAVPAIFKGLFYSKNILSKAAATWILLWLITLYPQTVTTFSIYYLLVWISIGICYSRKIRNMPEYAVKNIFKVKYYKRI